MTAARRRTQEFTDEMRRAVISTSKPIKDVATAYGVGPATLRNWLASSGPRVSLTTATAYPSRRCLARSSYDANTQTSSGRERSSGGRGGGRGGHRRDPRLGVGPRGAESLFVVVSIGIRFDTRSDFSRARRWRHRILRSRWWSALRLPSA